MKLTHPDQQLRNIRLFDIWIYLNKGEIGSKFGKLWVINFVKKIKICCLTEFEKILFQSDFLALF